MLRLLLAATTAALISAQPAQPVQPMTAIFGGVGPECDVLRGSELMVGESPAIMWEDSKLEQNDGTSLLKLKIRVPAIYDNTAISFQDAQMESAAITDTSYQVGNNGAGWTVSREDCYRYYEVTVNYQNALAWLGLTISDINNVPHMTAIVRVLAEESVASESALLDAVTRSVSYTMPFRIQLATHIEVAQDQMTVEELVSDYASVLTHVAQATMDTENFQPELQLKFVTALTWPYKMVGSPFDMPGLFAFPAFTDVKHLTGEISIEKFSREGDCTMGDGTDLDTRPDCIQNWTLTTRNQNSCFVDGEYQVSLDMACNTNPNFCDFDVIDRINEAGGVQITFVIETEQGKNAICGRVLDGEVELEGWLRSYDEMYFPKDVYESLETAYFQTGVRSSITQVDATSIRQITVGDDVIYSRSGAFGENSYPSPNLFGLFSITDARRANNEGWGKGLEEPGQTYETCYNRFDFEMYPGTFPTADSVCTGSPGCESFLWQRQCEAANCNWTVGQADYTIGVNLDVTYEISGERRRRLVEFEFDGQKHRRLEESDSNNDTDYADEAKYTARVGISKTASTTVEANVDLPVSVFTFRLLEPQFIEAYANTMGLPLDKVFVAGVVEITPSGRRRLSEDSGVQVTYGVHVYSSEDQTPADVVEAIKQKTADAPAFAKLFQEKLEVSISQKIEREAAKAAAIENEPEGQRPATWQKELGELTSLVAQLTTLKEDVKDIEPQMDQESIRAVADTGSEEAAATAGLAPEVIGGIVASVVILAAAIAVIYRMNQSTPAANKPGASKRRSVETSDTSTTDVRDGLRKRRPLSQDPSEVLLEGLDSAEMSEESSKKLL